MLFPGVEAALAALKAAGWRMGICTNKPEALAQLLLDRLGVRAHFGALLGADTLAVRKPDPDHVWQTISRVGGDRRRAVMIGDTATDVNAARAAGIPCAVAGFVMPPEQISALSPEAVFHSYHMLPDILEQLVPAG